MKKFFGIFILALTLVGAFYFWPTEKKVEDNPKKETKVVSENRKLFLGKRKHISKKSEITTSNCQQLLTELNDLDFNQMDVDLASLSLDSCSESEKINQLKAKCSGKEKHTCQAELMMFRAYLRTKGVEFSEDKEMIADLILTEFQKKTPDFKKLEKLVGELLNQNPENQTYQKLWAMNKLLANIEQKPIPKNLKEDIYSRLDPELLDDPELTSYRMFLETGLDPIKAEGFARDYLKRNPNRADIHETLGWSLWHQNKRAEAIAQVERAIALNPKDPWLDSLYSRIKSPEAGRESYEGRMNMGIRFEDIYQ